MATEHQSITDPEIHEPKDVSTALENAVYVCDGAASGVWTVLKDLNKIYLTVGMADVGTADSVWVVAPLACTFTKLYSVVYGDPGADSAITTEIAGTAVTDGGLTIANGATAGEVDSATPTAANTLTAGQALEIITDGGGTNVVEATFTVELTLS